MSPCNRCGSLGILHLKAIGEPQEALVFCSCDWSKLSVQIWKLPRINRAIEEAFNITRCPVSWFKPTGGRIDRGAIIPNITPNVGSWLSRIRSAEEFWKEYGPLFDRGWRPHGEKDPA